MTAQFQIRDGMFIAPSLEKALEVIRHGGALGEFPGIREVAKMDTPHGLWAGCCTCGWKSDGLNNEKGAWEASKAHVRDKHPITFTETVRAGVSTITCNLCGATVTKELAHVKEHQS